MKYEWITDEMFDRELAELLDDCTGDDLLQIPGIYELAKEHFNNEVLEACEEHRRPIGEFIKEHRAELDAEIRRVTGDPNFDIDDDDREQWIATFEPWYLRARSEGFEA